MNERPHGLGMSLDDLFSENQPITLHKDEKVIQREVPTTPTASEEPESIPATQDKVGETVEITEVSPKETTEAPQAELATEKSESLLGDALSEAWETETPDDPEETPKTYSHIVVRGVVED